ncbi:MAG: MBL fold metallo-hydrolase [Bacteroidota bacterium]|nr:MBL fold metallo-hydrolase [Bacteroidota bacterium]
MKIGDYEIFTIETSRFALDGGAMFGVVPQALWRKTNPPDKLNRIEMVTRSLLIVGGGKKILVDTGNSPKMSQKLKDIYKIDTTSTSLISSLQKHNVATNEITDVILTHLHFDHAGGSTFDDSGIIKPTFPNAKYYVQKEQWNWALNPTDRDRASFFKEDFLPLKEFGVLELVEGEFEIFPGINLILLNGHTSMQQIPKISDGINTVLFCADLVPMSSHIPLPFIMGYDLQPLVTLEEKRKIIGPAYEEKWKLVFEHDPKIAAATIASNEKGFGVGEVIQLL